MMKLTYEQAFALVKQGQIDLGNGRTLRFRQEHGSDTSINDCDEYGKVEPIWRGEGDRPQDFDGMAEKLNTYRDNYWWQPPEDLRKGWHNYEHKDHLRNVVKEILSFGFDSYWLEICQGQNAYGEPIVVDYTVTGGHEPLPKDEDTAHMLMDMAYELDTESKIA